MGCGSYAVSQVLVGLHRVGITRAACLPQRGHMIDIDTKQNWIHMLFSLLSYCRPEQFS